MRKFAKISAVLAAMVLALAFVGCKDDDDDDDPSVVTTWAISEEGYKTVVTFYDDGSFKVNGSDEEGDFSETGKYSGDTTKDGEIVITYDDGETETIIIKTENGKTYFDSYQGTYFKQ
ncbi:MAG: hypothetical protein Q4P16_08440 [Spirochaetales bacterium]|nr:hypothetical protein [Spirochaetales bacterium]